MVNFKVILKSIIGPYHNSERNLQAWLNNEYQYCICSQLRFSCSVKNVVNKKKQEPVFLPYDTYIEDILISLLPTHRKTLMISA